VTSPSFEALLAVQDLDTTLDQHRRRRSGLPERGELAAIDTWMASVDQRLAEASSRRDEVAARQDTLEQELAATVARKSDISKRLYGGTVSATRDLQAMAAEVESLAGRASDLEDRVFALMEEREPLEAEVAVIEGEKGRLGAKRAGVQERIDAAEAEIDAEIQLDNDRRAEAAAGVPADLMATYEQLRTRLGGVGAARLVGPSCTGCHLVLPSTELDRLRKGPPDALVFCDQCGRILVR
jgi:predicted  nucleic acid-binding Zn-ribbon protein